MTSFKRWAALGVFASLASTQAFAQILEVEPNDAKATATPALGLISGQFLDGNSTSATGVGLDYWQVSTAVAGPAIYRHELVITTTGTAGHTGTLRGLNQTGGVVGICPANGTSGTVGTTDSIVQTSSTASTPARMNAWYGFGKGEQIYYRVTGGATTTANYNATLTSTAVTPIVVPGTFAAGPITLKTDGQTTTDTDIYLYDANFNLVMSPEGAASNDDEHCQGSNGLQSWLTRTLTPGTYYLAVGAYNTCSNLVSPTDDDFMTGLVTDFGDQLVCSATGTGSDRDFQITDGVNTYTSSGVLTTKYFEITWVQFTVSGGPPVAICDPGAAGVIACPCANPPSGAGRGCDNSIATGGATIAASGSSNLAGDTLVFTTGSQTLNGTTILLQGTANNGTGTVFGQGVRCVAGSLKRLYVKSPGGTGGITAPAGADLTVSARSAALGDTITAGSHRYYMAYYRDPIVLGGCPATSSFNATPGVDVAWN